MGVDGKGRLRGIAIGRNLHTIQLLSAWGFELGLIMVLDVPELGRTLIVLNMYQTYEDSVISGDSLFAKYIMSCDSLIMGGDLNFSIGEAKIQGDKARVDLLINYFFSKISRGILFNIEHVKLRPTWKNKRIKPYRIKKRLDRFLTSKKFVEISLRVREWVGSRQGSHHYPIFLDMVGDSQKLTNPFKFNSSQLSDEGFKAIIRKNWVPIDIEGCHVVEL